MEVSVVGGVLSVVRHLRDCVDPGDSSRTVELDVDRESSATRARERQERTMRIENECGLE